MDESIMNSPTIVWTGGAALGSKCVISLDRDGVINEYIDTYCFNPDDFKPIPGSLEAMSDARRKGYKLVIITEQGGIEKGLFTPDDVEKVNTYMFELLGQAGCLDIEMLYFSASSRKDDLYAPPNTGMFKRCETEHKHIKFNKGYYVGHTIKGLRAGFKMGATPVLVRTGKGSTAEKDLNRWANRDLKAKTIIVDNLEEFVKQLD
jgi:D-glycero-D-manno-heptose 1,7-bisphosphate phosphatase